MLLTSTINGYLLKIIPISLFYGNNRKLFLLFSLSQSQPTEGESFPVFPFLSCNFVCCIACFSPQSKNERDEWKIDIIFEKRRKLSRTIKKILHQNRLDLMCVLCSSVAAAVADIAKTFSA